MIERIKCGFQFNVKAYDEKENWYRKIAPNMLHTAFYTLWILFFFYIYILNLKNLGNDSLNQLLMKFFIKFFSNCS